MSALSGRTAPVTGAARGIGETIADRFASVSAEGGGGVIDDVWYGATKAGVVALTRGLAERDDASLITGETVAAVDGGFLRA